MKWIIGGSAAAALLLAAVLLVTLWPSRADVDSDALAQSQPPPSAVASAAPNPAVATHPPVPSQTASPAAPSNAGPQQTPRTAMPQPPPQPALPGGKVESAAPAVPLAQPPLASSPESAQPPPVAPLPPSISNTIGTRLALIQPGTFLMGDDRLADAPRHEVTITRPFYIGVCEVTEGELRAVLGEVARGPDLPDELPAAFVSWNEAAEFCKQLSELPEEKAAGRVYRLPTEAEWEYACRAGTKTNFAFGDTIDEEQANFGRKINLASLRREGDSDRPPPPPRRGARRPPPRGGHGPGGREAPGGPGEPPEDSGPRPLERAGAFPPNPWRLHDMHGSVWEWCADWYADDTYKSTPRTDPTGPPSGTSHVARGGCWSSPMIHCASAYRNGKAEPINPRQPLYGFRIVCEVRP